MGGCAASTFSKFSAAIFILVVRKVPYFELATPSKRITISNILSAQPKIFWALACNPESKPPFTLTTTYPSPNGFVNIKKLVTLIFCRFTTSCPLFAALEQARKRFHPQVVAAARLYIYRQLSAHESRQRDLSPSTQEHTPSALNENELEIQKTRLHGTQ